MSHIALREHELTPGEAEEIARRCAEGESNTVKRLRARLPEMSRQEKLDLIARYDEALGIKPLAQADPVGGGFGTRG